MNYGMYVSASGVLTNMYRQDVLANNLANVETVGYKPDVPSIKQRDPEVIEDGLGFAFSHELLDRLGGGVLAGPQRVSFQPGPVVPTGNLLDVALAEEDTFFTVRAFDAATGAQEVRYTRDGRFSPNAQGELVTQGGHRVLGPDGQPIVVGLEGPVRIDEAGQVVTVDGGEVVGQLGVVRIADTTKLIKRGGNQFSWRGSGAPGIAPVAEPRVHGGHVEGSSVDPIRTLMGIQSASRAAGTNADMLKYFDRMMEQTVSTLGRVA